MEKGVTSQKEGNNPGIIYPAPLQPGDKIALISPASVVKKEYVEGAIAKIRERGYEPVLMPHALGPNDGSFASGRADRIMDLLEALDDSEVKAILCTRGGYGCCQLLANLSSSMVSSNPKWIIGFSDVSALLALWQRSNIASIHGPMAKHLATMPDDDQCTSSLFEILENGGKFDYKVSPHPYNVAGKASGTLLGGNMAVLTDLADTPCDLYRHDGEDVIYFFEDISEPIYKVNRMLWRMFLAGELTKAKALIFGQFTEYKPDANYSCMEDMILDFLKQNKLWGEKPIAFNFPTGHTDRNLPLIVGAKVELEVSAESVGLRSM